MEEQEGLRSSRSGDDDLPVGDALSPEAQPQWEKVEPSTLERMKHALEKIVLFDPSGIPGYPGTEDETFTAAMAILPAAKGETLDRSVEESKVDEAAKENSSRVEDGRKLAANASVGYLASADADLKAQKAALAKRELAKCQTFNLKQIITRNGTVL
ncbi:hypothetical protein FOZ62_018427, partial [Perkinsus olseni]